ncbi:SPOR domain-containing protein [Desulfobacula toluolica]|uniref:Tetratricopeptide repeat protein, presursor n=1 Tax=Desulfobacula toluolica (strain DSM 7467 / Tol2) TaxID=651182 RepID=K0NDG2_DESTT|nr:SPOR domain-containing protein [Desulfobacula toluolica]CCK78936.1 tetratricopeptide repeat protein, presursor [Desulfobacula toluolica Tol2]
MKKEVFLILLALSFHTLICAETEKEILNNGIFFFKQDQYLQAVDEFSKLIDLAPNNADAYKNRGVSYMKQEKFDLAIKDFETAKKLAPELKGLYSNLGVAWYYKKEYEKAIENYDIEIKTAPENHVAYFNRALCLAELNRNGEALDDLSKTLNLKPDYYWAICCKADLLAQAGDNIRAIETYEEAIRQDPENRYATENLTQIRQKINEQENLDQKNDKSEGNKTLDPEYALQAGAFLNQINADKMKTRLQNNKFDSRILVLKDARNRTWYLVRSGRYHNQNEAKKAKVSLKKKLGIKSIIRPFGVW